MKTDQSVSELPTTYDLYQQLKSLSGKETAYAVAKHFGWNAGTVRRWEKKHSTLDEDHVRMVADALGYDRGYVALCVSIERTANANLADQMRHWLLSHSAAASLAGAVISVGFALAALPAVASAAQGVCILCQIATGRLRRLSAVLTAESVAAGRSYHSSAGWPPFIYSRSRITRGYVYSV